VAQFDVYVNANAQTHAATPLLLDVQSDLIADLDTRVVVPLRLASAMNGQHVKILMPVFDIENDHYVMLTPLLAGISIRQLGAKLASLSHQRDDIIAALDLLITGI
jgi:toxin CcdB